MVHVVNGVAKRLHDIAKDPEKGVGGGQGGKESLRLPVIWIAVTARRDS